MSNENENVDPWLIHVEEDAEGRWQKIACTLTAKGLHEVLFGPVQTKPVRSADLKARRSVLLLSDVITLENQLIAINLFARRNSERAEQVVFELLVNPELELNQQLTATLHWGDYHRAVILDSKGRALFSDIPITSLIDITRGPANTDLHIILVPSITSS